MSIIDEIKQRLDIVQVASDYITLQKAGRNFKALCPFHAEKTPSFFIFPEQQSWRCFGACGSGGDIYSFIMKKENLDFGQALRLLADKAGVTLVSPGLQDKEQDKRRDRLFRINEATSAYYHHLLLNTSTGEKARKYLDQRGLSPQTIDEFQLGYSRDSYEDLRQHLLNEDYAETELLDAGLVLERDGGGSYDRFRNRLMFPIRDIQGRVTGFGARALDESLPKYLNSPQTLLFDKSSSLYGIDRAKTAIRQNNLATIMEGYMDVLTAHQHGWENTVASMGTALTEKQVAVLRKLTRNLVFALDADTAGEEATLRTVATIDIESYLNAEVKVIILPQGKDPDEVIRDNQSIWSQLLTKAKPINDFILETIIEKTDLGSAYEKSVAVDKLLPVITKIGDPIRQAHYLQRLAQLLKIDERALADKLRQFRSNEKKRSLNKNYRNVTISERALSVSNPREEYCLAMLLQYPELRSECTMLSPDYFERTENRELFLQWQQNPDPETLRNSLSTALHEHLNNLLAQSLPVTLRENEEEQRQDLNECITRLQERWLRSLVAKKAELLSETEEITEQLNKLEEQGIEESRQLKQIFAMQSHRRQPKQ